MSIGLLTLALAITQFPAADGRADAPAVRAQDDVERAAREFRRNVYLNFRTNREEFDRRWTAGDELHRHWKALNQPVAHREAVAGWFAEAARTAAFAELGGLPSMPYLPEPSLPTVFNDPQRPTVENLPPLPQDPLPEVALPDDENATDDGNLFLQGPLDDDDALPANPADEGDLSGSIRSILDFSETVFGGQ